MRTGLSAEASDEYGRRKNTSPKTVDNRSFSDTRNSAVLSDFESVEVENVDTRWLGGRFWLRPRANGEEASLAF